MFTPPSPHNGLDILLPKPVYPPFDDDEPPPFNEDWNFDMSGCSPPCNAQILPMPHTPGCSPPCTGEDQGWVYAMSGNEQEQAPQGG